MRMVYKIQKKLEYFKKFGAINYSLLKMKNIRFIFIYNTFIIYIYVCYMYIGILYCKLYTKITPSITDLDYI